MSIPATPARREIDPHTAQIVRTVKTVSTYIVLVIVALLILFPLLFSLSLAIQGPTGSPALVPNFGKLDFSAFLDVFKQQKNLGRWILNSFVVALTVTLGQVISSVLAGYALSTLNFPGKNLFFFAFLATLLIPWESTIVPNYLFISGLNWKNSYQGLIVPFLASGFGIFLLRQYFLTIPRDFYEAASIDGCGRNRYLWSILLPLSRPALATVAVYAFLNTYNQFYWPLLVVDNDEWKTTQIGIAAFQEVESLRFNLQMAANLIVLLPTLLLLIIGQRQLVRGLTEGALKG